MNVDVEVHFLDELLITSRDGDWGSEFPAQGLVPYRVIRGADFPSARIGKIAEVPLRYLPDHSVGRRTLEPGDIVIETAGGTKDRPTGRSLYITKRLLASLDNPATCASFARFLRIDPRKANRRFIYWYLQHLHQSGEMWQHQVQHTGVARFQYTHFARTHRIVLPSRQQQQAVSEVLGAFDDRIMANFSISSSCHALAQACLAGVRDDFSMRPLSELSVITMGSSPPGETYNEKGSGLPFYQGARDFGERFPRHRVWCTEPVRAAQESSILISVRAPVGRVNVARELCCIGRGVASLESRVSTPSVLFHELAAASEIWKPYESEGTVFGAINKGQMETLCIPSLDQVSARKLEEILSPLDQRVAAAFNENNVLTDLRDALLSALMSGEMQVREAERIVEDAT